MTDATKALAHALTLATRLRTISERSRDAEFKGLVADLLLDLAEAQLNLEELVSENLTLKGGTSEQDVRCPRCFELGWKVTGTRTDKSGRLVEIYSCPKCKLKEEVFANSK